MQYYKCQRCSKIFFAFSEELMIVKTSQRPILVIKDAKEVKVICSRCGTKQTKIFKREGIK